MKWPKKNYGHVIVFGPLLGYYGDTYIVEGY